MHMKKIYLFGLILLITGVACKKKEEECTSTLTKNTAPATEEQMVTDYITANAITGTTELENSGMYYIITSPGSTERANQCSVLRVKYTGKFTDGRVFDQTVGDNVATFELGGLIEGWRRALPLIGEGGKIRLFIPPTLGYGSVDRVNPQTGVILIPKNSVLVFDVELLTITN